MQNGTGDANDASRYESVKDYYSNVLQSSKDLKTSACTAGDAFKVHLETALEGLVFFCFQTMQGPSFNPQCEQCRWKTTSQNTMPDEICAKTSHGKILRLWSSIAPGNRQVAGKSSYQS
jgi:hypothetical protein